MKNFHEQYLQERVARSFMENPTPQWGIMAPVVLDKSNWASEGKDGVSIAHSYVEISIILPLV
jgi:hypothetical protein